MSGLGTAFILGIVEGLTEFLPVSSSGHLIIASSLLEFTGEKADFFTVFIQLGAILAVVVMYWNRFWGLLFPPQGVRFSGMRGILLLVTTCLPASLIGLFVHKTIKHYLFFPWPVAAALAFGALYILFVEWKSKDIETTTMTLDDISFKTALGVGLFQCLALWPGFSRSASTIMGGLLLGMKRQVAIEYSFFAAVPIMFAATGYDLIQSWHFLEAADVPFLATGFIVSFISALIAIKTFLLVLNKFTFRPFAYYRLLLAPLVYFFM